MNFRARSVPFPFRQWLIVAATLGTFVGLTAFVSTAGASDTPKLVAVAPDGQAAMTITLEQGTCPVGSFAAVINTVPASATKLNGCYTVASNHVIFLGEGGTIIVLHPEDFEPQGTL